LEIFKTHDRVIPFWHRSLKGCQRLWKGLKTYFILKCSIIATLVLYAYVYVYVYVGGNSLGFQKVQEKDSEFVRAFQKCAYYHVLNLLFGWVVVVVVVVVCVCFVVWL
jgi:hypothetical protein